MRLGEPEVRDGWVEGRTVFLSGASVVTMGPDDDLVGDVVIRDDRIVAVGPGAGADAPDDALRVDASGTVVIPGLVDGHVHAWEGALRGVSPDSGFYDYMALTHGMLGPLMTPDDIAVGQRVTALRALEQGVTTIIDNCHNTRSPSTATPRWRRCSRSASAPCTPRAWVSDSRATTCTTTCCACATAWPSSSGSRARSPSRSSR